MKNKLLLCLLFFLVPFCIFAQRGKDGARTVTAANTNVNMYTALTANAVAGSTSITVSSTGALNGSGGVTYANNTFSTGDLIMIIQVQGAIIRGVLSGASGTPDDTTWGGVTNYNNTGKYEFAEVSAIPNTTTIQLVCGLQYNYTSAGRTQVIRVPRFSSLTINNGGILTCPDWLGTTGGVLSVEVLGNTLINAGGKINVTGKGFRGGALHNNAAGGPQTIWLAANINTDTGGEKGESIAGYQTDYTTYGGRYCRGAPANGGGGGNAWNSGGAGGANAGDTSAWRGFGNPDNSTANYISAWNLEHAGFANKTSSGGGKGGYTWSSQSRNPTTVPPGDPLWGTTPPAYRNPQGGWGGRPLDYSTGKIFFGGGGGAGDEENSFGGAGGDGGGIVYLMSYGTVSGNDTLIADGSQGGNTSGNVNSNTNRDGAGGGGGGGVVIVNSTGTISGVVIRANGGRGGNQINIFGGLGETEGPGGGGGGGYIAVSNGTATTFATGGRNGTTASPQMTLFPPNGATSGGAGIANGVITNFSILANGVNICEGQTASLVASLTGTVPSPTPTIYWYTSAVGGSSVGTGSPYVTPVLTTTTTYYVGSCPGTYRIAVTVTVTPTPTVTATPASASVCSGTSVNLSASGATNYSWTPATGLSTTTGSNVTANPTVSTTYTLTGSTAGCSNTSSVVVTVTSPLVVNASPPSSTLCSGSSVNLTATGATNYTWTPAAGLSTTTGNTVTANPTVTTTYTVTGITGSCSNTTTAVVTVNSVLTINTTPSASTICAGGSVNMTATGASNYRWTPATGLNTTTGSSVTANPTTSTTYTITGTSGSCSNTSVAVVTVNSFIVVNASPSASAICTGGSVNMSTTGATNYTWAPSTGLSSTTGSSVTASPTASTTYTITGTSGSCSNTTVAVVTVSGSIAMNITPAAPTICAGDSVSLSASGATNYTWLPSGSLSGPGSPFAANVNAKPTSTTTYTVIGTSGSCSASSNVVVNVGSSLSMGVNASSGSICSGSSATLTATGATNYTWTPATGLSATTGSSVTAAPGSTITYTVTGSSGSCSNMATVAITVTTVSIAVSPNGITVCPGTLTTLTATGATNYTWTPAAGLITTSGSVVNASPVSSSTYTVIGTSGGCSNSTLVVLNVSSQLAMGVNPSSNSICAGGSATLTATGASTYTWTPATGLSATSGSSVTANPVSSQTYTVFGVSSNCSNSVIVIVNVVSTLPVAGTPSSTSICPGSSVLLTASGAANYTWSPANGLSTTLGTSVTASPTITTTYTITGSSGTCSNTAIVVVTIVNSITVSASPPVNTICPGGSVILTATGATNYTWIPASGLNTSTGSTVSAGPITSTSYTVTGASGTCSNTSLVIVNVNSVLAVGATAPSSVCQGIPATITATGATNYSWYPATGLNTSTGSPVMATPAASITYTVVGLSGTCSNSSTVSITVNPNPSANAGNNVTIILGTRTTLVASGGVSYSWYPSTGLSCVNCQVTQASPLVTTTYYVRVTNSFGCTSIDSVRVTVDIQCGEIFVPNAFSPNGDQNNDILEVYGKSCIRKLTFIVYDRWGEKVFETEDPLQGWDGRHKNKDMDPAVFVYYLNAILINNQQVISKGNVSLLR